MSYAPRDWYQRAGHRTRLVGHQERDDLRGLAEK